MVDTNALNKISYGLFVLTAKKDGKNNGCIINAAQQVTVSPDFITIAVNKQNYTHDIIAETGMFNVSTLTEDVSFDLFKHFGFQSGKTIDKFFIYKILNFPIFYRGIYYVTVCRLA